MVLARRRRPTGRTPPGFGEALATEFALISALYSIWRIARKLPLAQDAGAIERARTIVDVQEAMYLPSELGLQEFILNNDWLGWPTTLYYATLHVPTLIAFLVWLFVWHRDQYPHWRNGLVFLTGTCLVIRFWRVAPPRFPDRPRIRGPVRNFRTVDLRPRRHRRVRSVRCHAIDPRRLGCRRVLRHRGGEHESMAVARLAARDHHHDRRVRHRKSLVARRHCRNRAPRRWPRARHGIPTPWQSDSRGATSV